MGTLTATSSLFYLLVTISTSVRIGLPEDHVDTNACFDGTCISENDWSEIGEKWHNFKETVDMIDNSNSTNMRQKIWAIFNKGDFWNGDERQIAQDLSDIRNNRYAMDRNTEEVRMNQYKDVTTRYDHQAIIAMEGDITVEKAAHFLYNKHPSVSTLYEYNPKTDTLKVVAGKEHYLGKHSRVQIVGHGRDTIGQMRMSDMTPKELARVVRKLPIEATKLGRVSLVGCNLGKQGQSDFLNAGFTEQFLKALKFEQDIHAEVSSRNGLLSVTASGRKETGEITSDGIQWFHKDALSKTVLTLGEFNEVKHEEIPLTERIATFNQESSGALVKLTDVKTKEEVKPIYIEKSDDGNIETVKRIEHANVNEFIKSVTLSNFLDGVEFVKQKLINNPNNAKAIKDMIKSTLGLENIPDNNLEMTEVTKTPKYQQDGKSILHYEFYGKMFLTDAVHNARLSDEIDFRILLDLAGKPRIEFKRNDKIKSLRLDTGIPSNEKYVARLNNAFEREIKVEEVRTIRNRADLLYEINMLGIFGVDFRSNGNLFRYYRFGDVVYRMARKNFYINWEGMIASDDGVQPKHRFAELVNEHDILNVKRWIWRNNQNRNVFPRDYKFEDYPRMMKSITETYLDNVINKKINELSLDGTAAYEDISVRLVNKEDISFTLTKKGMSPKRFTLQYDSGNVLRLMDFFRSGDHSAIEKNLLHILEGSTVLAIGLSEPVRNFRAYSINEMLLHLNSIESISLPRLIEAHPMTRGKSWGFLGYTGLDVTMYGYKRMQQDIVYPRELNIGRMYLLSRTGTDGKSDYRFLTETDYNQIEKEISPGNLAEITSPLQPGDIQTIADFRPEVQDVRTRPLGNAKIQSITDLGVNSDIASSKALPIRASVSYINDYIFLTNQLSTAIARKGQATGIDYDIIESSIVVEKDTVKLTVVDKSNPSLREELSIKIEEDLLTSKKIQEETSRRIEDTVEKRYIPSKSLTSVNEFLGVYGIVMGFRGAVQDFEDGKIFEGVMNVAQSIHGLYGMSRTAQRVFQKITSKLVSKGLETIERSLSAVATEMRTVITEATTAVEESITVAGEALGDVPVLGTVFGVYNTIQDIRRGTAIGYVDAALDAAITISAFFGPEALVVTVALTIVRLVIDDFYYGISNELNKLPADATTLQKIGAVIKGIGEGIVMVIKNIADFFYLGFLSFSENFGNIEEQYSKDHALLRKLSDFHSYFKIGKEDGSHEKIIDFLSGEESWNGGNILFHLFDDNTARLRMQIVDEEGRENILDKYLPLEEGTDDIVLGIGESHDISFKKHTAKILWFIPVHSRYLISDVRGEKNSLHGTYYGNSKNNKFFAIQKFPEDVNLEYSLSDYFYELYGEDGDDIFYLGPQRSVVNGGNGRDTYVIPYSGGRTEINNYAEDLAEDTLFIQVDLERIQVDRNGNDLVLRHGHDHDIVVKGWFSGHRMGHLMFRAKQGVIFNVTIGVYGKASLLPIAVNLSGDKKDHTIDVSRGIWKSVVVVTGSDGSDTIIANDNDNLLNGGKGSNTMQGGSGSDTYLMYSVDRLETSQWNIINNLDPHLTVDKVIFDVPFTDIVTNVNEEDFQLFTHSNYGPKVILKNWFSSEHYRHMLFVTTDDVIFKLADDKHNQFLLHPIILDASKETSQVHLDASSSDFINVSTIIGSDFDDSITGNTGNNYIKGGKGRDTVAGGEGRDVYVLRQEDVGDYIYNYADDKKEDLILADFCYDDISVYVRNTDAVLSVSDLPIVTIMRWMEGAEWRHITVRTIDGVSFKLEWDPVVEIRKSPVEIDKSGKSTRQKINTNTKALSKVEYIIGSNATDRLIGNQNPNRIDPGFGGAYMMALDGHDQYVIMDHYKGPNIVNNFANDNLTDTVKLPAYFSDVKTNVSGNDIIISSFNNPSATVTLQKYKTDALRRHLVINTVKDGIVFTIPPSRDFQPTPISIDRTNQAHNIIVDLHSNSSWDKVITVLGTKEHSNVIIGNNKNNTLTGGKLSDTLEGGSGNDVIRGNEGDDFIDGEDGDDTLVGGAGEDWIDGGMGNDLIYPGPGGDHVKGGPGFDVVICFGDAVDRSGVFIDLQNGYGHGGDAHEDVYISIEGAIGGFYSDILVGDHSDNYLDGKEGNDILFPLNGNDILVGGDGKDVYDVGNAEGEKVIRNEAKDGEMDLVNLKLYELELIYLERRDNDLLLYVGMDIEGIFCPKHNTGPLHFEQWYNGTTFQHLLVQLARTELVLDNFSTGGVEVQVESFDRKFREEMCERILNEELYYLYYY